MSEVNIYKLAAQKGLRFPSIKNGLGVTVEQLFAMPLTSKTGHSLNDTAKAIAKAIKDSGEEEFVTSAKADPRVTELKLSLEIVRDVITTIEAENAASAKASENRALKQKLLEKLEGKRDKAYDDMTAEQLEAKIAAL